jgi:hypothetical protein
MRERRRCVVERRAEADRQRKDSFARTRTEDVERLAIGLEQRPSIVRPRRSLQHGLSTRLPFAPAGDRTAQPAEPIEVRDQRMSRRRMAERVTSEARRQSKVVVP